MKIYTLFDSQGKFKWVEDRNGTYLVDPHYINEFCAIFKDVKGLPINVNVY